MTYEEAKEFLSSATFIYVGVTDDEYDAIPVPSYRTYINEISVAGTNERVEALSSKELKQGSVSFV